MQPQPAVGNGTLKTGLIFGWRALQLKQERPVDLLDMDAAVLHPLDGVGQLDQLAGGGFGIGEGTIRDELHSSALFAWSAARKMRSPEAPHGYASE